MNRVAYLQELCNKYGDFYITNSYKDDNGNLHWFKHRSVLECWQSDKGLWFLSKTTHRTCLKCEVVLDMDDLISEVRLNNVCDTIERKYGFPYIAYLTGSKGYHIHILITEILKHNYNLNTRNLMREALIGKFTGFSMDEMKISEKSMIALENVPHWKTDNMKTVVRQFGNAWV